MAITGAQAIWEALVREGVTEVFGYPGGAILPAYDAMRQFPIRHVLAADPPLAGSRLALADTRFDVEHRVRALRGTRRSHGDACSCRGACRLYMVHRRIPSVLDCLPETRLRPVHPQWGARAPIGASTTVSGRRSSAQPISLADAYFSTSAYWLYPAVDARRTVRGRN